MPFDLQSPIDKKALKRLDDRPEFVQFSAALSDKDYRYLGRWIAEHPAKTLRAYGSYGGSIIDLEFLRWFPEVRRFQVDVYGLENFDGLRFLREDLSSLGLGATRKRQSLDGLSRFKNLTCLFLEGHTKGIDVVAGLTALRDLVLRSITLPNLELLTSLRELEALDLKLGGTKDLELLPSVGRLRYLELWQIKGLENIDAVGKLADLEYLFLQSLRRVDHLPDFAQSTSLSHVWLETMKGLSDLSPLARAPRLANLALIDMPHLAPDDLLPLRESPSLQKARVGLGSTRKNERATEVLGDVMLADWPSLSRDRYRHWNR